MKQRYIKLGGSLVLIAALSHIVTAKAIDTRIEEGTILFHVRATDRGSINRLTITPRGLSEENRPVTMEIEGIVTDVKSADLNGDGSPELYIFVSGAGSGSYGDVVAFAVNRKKSMSRIHFPEVDPNDKSFQGYMGHDEFRIEKGYLVRRFPLYRTDDPNCCPGGGHREIYYRLVPGEAMWQLKAVKTVESE